MNPMAWSPQPVFAKGPKFPKSAPVRKDLIG